MEISATMGMALLSFRTYARLLRFLSRAHANFPLQGVARSVRIKRGCFIEDVAPRGGRGTLKWVESVGVAKGVWSVPTSVGNYAITTAPRVLMVRCSLYVFFVR